MLLGRAICAVESFWSTDGCAKYSHAGIIIKADPPTTFEALWTNCRQNLFKAYHGKQILIGRHEQMDPYRIALGWDAVYRLEGRWYAGHRLGLHLFPPLARMFASGTFAVCSELAAKFLHAAGILHIWQGVNPDYLSEVIVNHRGWSIVFEGILEAT
jgi:hypothetical protein